MAAKKVKTDTSIAKEEIMPKVTMIRRKVREPVPANQTPRQRFERLAPRRVTNALNDIRRVGNLLNRNVYQPLPDELDRIEAALDKAIANLKYRLENAKKPRETGTKTRNVEQFRLQA